MCVCVCVCVYVCVHVCVIMGVCVYFSLCMHFFHPVSLQCEPPVNVCVCKYLVLGFLCIQEFRDSDIEELLKLLAKSSISLLDKGGDRLGYTD